MLSFWLRPHTLCENVHLPLHDGVLTRRLRINIFHYLVINSSTDNIKIQRYRNQTLHLLLRRITRHPDLEVMKSSYSQQDCMHKLLDIGGDVVESRYSKGVSDVSFRCQSITVFFFRTYPLELLPATVHNHRHLFHIPVICLRSSSQNCLAIPYLSAITVVSVSPT